MSQKQVALKLQIREGQKLLLVNPPGGYKEQLVKYLPRNVEVVRGTSKEADVIQVFTSSKTHMNEQLGKLKKVLAPRGIIWVTYPKATSKVKTDINRDIVRHEAEKFGLEAVAIFSTGHILFSRHGIFSSLDYDWSALRLQHAQLPRG